MFLFTSLHQLQQRGRATRSVRPIEGRSTGSTRPKVRMLKVHFNQEAPERQGPEPREVPVIVEEDLSRILWDQTVLDPVGSKTEPSLIYRRHHGAAYGFSLVSFL